MECETKFRVHIKRRFPLHLFSGLRFFPGTSFFVAFSAQGLSFLSSLLSTTSRKTLFVYGAYSIISPITHDKILIREDLNKIAYNKIWSMPLGNRTKKDWKQKMELGE